MSGKSVRSGTPEDPTPKKKFKASTGSHFEFLPILSDPELAPCEFVEAYAIEVQNKPKIISSLLLDVKTLNLPSPSHLKSIRRVGSTVWILVCLKGAFLDPPPDLIELVRKYDDQSNSTALPALNSPSAASISICIASIPARSPLSVRHVEEANQLSGWPFAAHALPFVVSTPPIVFSDEELTRIDSYVARVKMLAQETRSQGQRGVGCLMVRPGSDGHWRILAEAKDNSGVHVLDHAAMNCINKVAEGAMIAEVDGQYLCKDCYFFTTHEPCVMCAMALLHSRVAKVFYLNPKQGDAECDWTISSSNNANDVPILDSCENGQNMNHSLSVGGLGSRYKIHCHPSLNHNFHVYRLKPIDIT